MYYNTVLYHIALQGIVLCRSICHYMSLNDMILQHVQLLYDIVWYDSMLYSAVLQFRLSYLVSLGVFFSFLSFSLGYIIVYDTSLYHFW